MIEMRKLIVFTFVTFLFIYMSKLFIFTRKKWQFKTHTFATMLCGIFFITLATLFDVFSYINSNPLVHNLIQTFFTLGAIIYVISIMQWSNFTMHLINNLEKLSLTDPMTGVLNRSGLTLKFDLLSKSNSPFYVLLCDLDGTKQINDTYGHIEGDNFIQSTTKIIQNHISDIGCLARIGGDEFIILIQASSEDFVKEIIKNIKHEIDGMYLEHAVGISIGHSCFPDDGRQFNELTKLADKQMYINKASNKIFSTP